MSKNDLALATVELQKADLGVKIVGYCIINIVNTVNNNCNYAVDTIHNNNSK